MTKDKNKVRAGKAGQKQRILNHNKTRHELFVELGKYLDKQAVEFIQFSKVRWSNGMIAQLIRNYKNK